MTEDKAIELSTPLSVHIVDATNGPLVGDGHVRRVMPFAATAVVSTMVAVPTTSWARPGFAVGAAALAAATIVGALIVPWHRISRAAQLAPPFSFLVATLLMTSATGQGIGSAFVTMVVLPLMWLALYENRAAVLIAATMAGLALWLGALSGNVQPSDQGAVAVFVLVVCCAGMGITLHGLVADARELALALRKHQLALEHLTVHDSLTDLLNRRGFAAQSLVARDRARDEGLAFSMIYIDIDNFKGLNDTLGHDVGDRLLRELADRLRSLVGAGDSVARLGGDEFAVLVEGSDPAHALQLAERIELSLRLRYPAAPDASVSASVGIAHSAAAGIDPDIVLAAADVSMYEHKRQARRSRRTDVSSVSPTPGAVELGPEVLQQ